MQDDTLRPGDLPPELARRVESELRPGERLVWAGRPPLLS